MGNSETLEQIEKLLALNLIDDKEDVQAVQLLHRAGYTSAEIGNYIGMSPSTVRNKVSDLREKGRIND